MKKKLWLLLLSGLFFLPTSNIAQEKESSFSTEEQKVVDQLVRRREAREDKSSGHACGHHLFGTGSTAAAIAVKDWSERRGEDFEYESL